MKWMSAGEDTRAGARPPSLTDARARRARRTGPLLSSTVAEIDVLEESASLWLAPPEEPTDLTADEILESHGVPAALPAGERSVPDRAADVAADTLGNAIEQPSAKLPAPDEVLDSIANHHQHEQLPASHQAPRGSADLQPVAAPRERRSRRPPARRGRPGEDSKLQSRRSRHRAFAGLAIAIVVVGGVAVASLGGVGSDQRAQTLADVHLSAHTTSPAVTATLARDASTAITSIAATDAKVAKARAVAQAQARKARARTAARKMRARRAARARAARARQRRAAAARARTQSSTPTSIPPTSRYRPPTSTYTPPAVASSPAAGPSSPSGSSGQASASHQAPARHAYGVGGLLSAGSSPSG